MNTELSPREIIYYIIYIFSFIASISTGAISGFTGTHTPPMPFAIELFTLLFGFILFVIDATSHKSTKVHKIGLTINGLIMAVVLFLAFSHY